MYSLWAALCSIHPHLLCRRLIYDSTARRRRFKIHYTAAKTNSETASFFIWTAFLLTVKTKPAEWNPDTPSSFIQTTPVEPNLHLQSCSNKNSERDEAEPKQCCTSVNLKNEAHSSSSRSPLLLCAIRLTDFLSKYTMISPPVPPTTPRKTFGDLYIHADVLVCFALKMLSKRSLY